MTPQRSMVALAASAALVALPIAACTSTGPDRASCRPNGTELSVVAANHAFGADCLAAPADQAFTIALRNEDTSPHGAHNITIFGDDGVIFFTGKGLLPGGTSTVYEVQPMPAGTYEFRCDTHQGMNGTFIVG